MGTCEFIKQFINSDSFKTHFLDVVLDDDRLISVHQFFDTESQDEFRALIGLDQSISIPDGQSVLVSRRNHVYEYYFVTDKNISRYTLKQSNLKNLDWG